MFYLYETIQTDKAYLLNPIYQIIAVSILKNYSYRYYNNYIIKFIDFISIYYVINLNIVPCIIFNYLCFGSINLLQV